MDEQLIEAFDDCLRALEAGAPLDAALARYPQFADDLRPMLLTVQAARPLQPLRVPKQSEEASLARLLTRARDLRRQTRRGFSFWPQLTLVARLALIVLVLVAGGMGAASASAQALPGDLLYTIKRAVEQTRLTFADAPTRAVLEQQFEQRRLAETQAVITQRREAEVEFTGRVQAITGERWLIAGFTVQVRAGLAGDIGLGDTVKVWGRTQADGMIVASRLEKRTAGVAPTPRATPPAPTQSPIGTTPPPQVTPTDTLNPTATRPPATNTPAPPASTPTATVTPSQPSAATPTPGSGGAGPSPSNTPQPTESETPEPAETEFEGVVESTGGVWVIGGRSVVVNAQTEFRGNPQLGDRVEVKAWQLPDGTLVARRIEKKD